MRRTEDDECEYTRDDEDEEDIVGEISGGFEISLGALFVVAYTISLQFRERFPFLIQDSCSTLI